MTANNYDLNARMLYALKFYKELAMFENYEITSPVSRGMDGDTPFHMAAYDGRVDLLEDMLPFVEDINIAGDIGNTPLHYAVMKNHLAAVELLLKHGADIKRKNDYEDTPFEWMQSDPIFIDLLMSYKNSV